MAVGDKISRLLSSPKPAAISSWSLQLGDGTLQPHHSLLQYWVRALHSFQTIIQMIPKHKDPFVSQRQCIKITINYVKNTNLIGGKKRQHGEVMVGDQPHI